MEPILKVRNLTTRLQLKTGIFKVVDELSFDLYSGKTLGIVGESGSGKSMTALSIMQILPTPPALPPEGEVIYRGENLLKLSPKKMREIRGASIAMIFQDPMSSLNPVYTIGDQLMEVAEMHLGLFGPDAFEKSVQMLDEVGIQEPSNRIYDYPHQLSGGMKQRVMIAMALMCEPDILIADEPTTALDVTVQRQVLDLIQKEQKKRGMGLILITHDMGVIAEMADDVIVMYATQNVESGDVFSVFENRAHPYTQGLFDSLPQSQRAHEKLNAMKGNVPSLQKMPTGCHFHPRCPFVMEICKTGDVPLFKIEKEEHQAKCWLYDKNLKKDTR